MGNMEILQVSSSLEWSEKFLQRKYDLRSEWWKRVMLLWSLKQRVQQVQYSYVRTSLACFREKHTCVSGDYERETMMEQADFNHKELWNPLRAYWEAIEWINCRGTIA